jgi:hypothetical protein
LYGFYGSQFISKVDAKGLKFTIHPPPTLTPPNAQCSVCT